MARMATPPSDSRRNRPGRKPILTEEHIAVLRAITQELIDLVRALRHRMSTALTP